MTTKKIYYIYRHLRLDNDTIFYVGKGIANLKGRSEKTFYCRAFGKTKNGRSLWWHRIVKQHGYVVEIVFESSDKELITRKETEFIKLYGRKNLNRGTLVNFTNGGDGPNEIQLSQKTRSKMSRNNGIKGLFGEKHHNSKPVFVYHRNGTFHKKFTSRVEAAHELGLHQSDVVATALGRQRFTGSWIFRDRFQGDVIHNPVPVSKNLKATWCWNLETEVVRRFNSLMDVAKFLSSNHHAIRSACYRQSIYKGHIISYNEIKN